MKLIKEVAIEKIIDGYLFTYEDGRKAFEKTNSQILGRIKSLD